MNTSYQMTYKVKQLSHTRKKTFSIFPWNSVTPQGDWSGGSCSCYEAIGYLVDGPIKDWKLKIGDHFRVMPESQDIPPGWFVLETGTFCGKPMYPKIYCREDELEQVKRYLGIN